MRESFGDASTLFPRDLRTIVTLGVFDGVHRGHQAVLAETKRQAQEANAPAAVVTFDINPRSLLMPENAPLMVTSLKHRLILFQQAGMDGVCVLPFTHELAALSAADFIRDILVDELRARAIVLGYNAHFGANRRGDITLLKTLGKTFDFTAHALTPTAVNGVTVSSTAIRNAVQAGELSLAAEMLGRPVSVLGTVIAGRGLGGPLGFPTLNLNPHHELRPPTGVYITRTRCGDTVWESVTNIGRRPTLPSLKYGIVVETHLLNYAGNLYGQTVEVMFYEKLREEERFADREAIAAQISKDVNVAHDWFTAHDD